MAIVRKQVRYSLIDSAVANRWDVLVALSCLVFFAPLLLAICLLVRADGGYALVSHERTTGDGTIVKVWNFRTTKQETPRKFRNNQTELESLNFTKFGAMLHRTRLEVLPSLCNVSKGDMSLAEMLQDI
jgi:lipopolysaccharide/colanic/teichoic acid biosynthesis glycosyltransferase